MKYRCLILSSLITLLPFWNITALSQTAHPSQESKESKTIVYLVTPGKDASLKLNETLDMSQFMVNLLDLRLKELKPYKVERVDQEPSCAPASGKSNLQNAAEIQKDAAVGRSPGAYIIQASIKELVVRSGERELALDYELFKYEQCVRKSFIHFTERFTEAEALDYLNDMGNILALVLEKELLPKGKIVDLEVIAGNVGTGSEQIKDKLLDYIASRLSQEEYFQPRDLRKEKAVPQADYKIKGRFVPTRRRGVQFIVSVNKDGREESYRSAIIEARQDDQKLTNFYEAAANLAISFLKEVRFAAEAGLSGPLKEVSIASMEEQALKLMCEAKESSEECEPQYEAAIPLLTRLTQGNNVNTPRMFLLLGDVYTEMGEYLKAAETLDKYWKRLDQEKPETREFINRAGMAWYWARNYANSAERFDQSIRLTEKLSLPPQLDTHLYRVRSYRFGGEQIMALTALLESLQKLSASDNSQTGILDLQRELSDLVADLGPEELDKAISLLKAKKEIKQVANLIPLALVGVARNYHLGNKFDLMDNYLKQAEGFSEEDYPSTARAELFYLRGLWYKDKPKSTKSEEQADLDKAVTFLTQAVKQLYEEAYSPLYLLNHQLGKDHDTKALLETILSKNKDNVLTMRTLQYVYQDIGKFEDALKIAKTLEQDFRASINTYILEMDIAETHVLNKLYRDAETRFADVLQKHKISQDYLAVLRFFQFWCAIGQNNTTMATKAFTEWRKIMETARSSIVPVRWYFYAAKRFLNKHEDIPRGALLMNMIEAMMDNGKLLPTFNQ